MNNKIFLMADNTLPSFGLSQWFDVEDSKQVQDLLSTFNQQDEKKIGSKANLPKPTNIGTTGNRNADGKESKTSSTSGSGGHQTSFNKMAFSSKNQDFILEMQGGNNGQCDYSGEAESLPHGISTIDDSQLMEGTEILPEAEGDIVDIMPKLHLRLLAPYSRFRYSSEKVGGKGKRPRHFEQDDLEKHCLLDFTVDNYEGPAKVVAYCVNEQGHLHPYNLHGENCIHGVYVKRERLRPTKVIRLAKVSITTPKTKEYESNLESQKSYLEKVECGFGEVETYKEIVDKQVVYVMVKVILEENNREVLSAITHPIHNKKKGKEFRISDVEPVSAPANGNYNINVQKNKVLVVVTEDTAFPKEVGVIVRERDNSWIVQLKGPEIKVTKGAVVMFTPPQYKDPDIQEDVEVEICLFDVKTGAETEPVAFTYIATKDVYGTKIKGRKRKLDENVHIDHSSVSFDDLTMESRKILSALRTKSSSSLKSVDASSSESNSSTENLLNNAITISVDKVSCHQQQKSFADSHDLDVTMRQAQNQFLNASQLPYSSYAAPNSSIASSAVNATPARSESYSVTSAECEVDPFTLQQFVKEESNCYMLGQTLPAVTTSQIVITSAVHDSDQNYSTSLMPSCQTSNSHSTIPQQQQDTQSQHGMNISDVVLVSEQLRDILFVKENFPKLAPNQHLALISGQFVIVNDDTAEIAPHVQNSQQTLQNSQQPPSYQGSVQQAAAASTTNAQVSQPHLVTSSAQPQKTTDSLMWHQPTSPMTSANSASAIMQQTYNADTGNIWSGLSPEMQLCFIQLLQNHVNQTTQNQPQSVNVLQNQQFNNPQVMQVQSQLQDLCGSFHFQNQNLHHEDGVQGASVGCNLNDEDLEVDSSVAEDESLKTNCNVKGIQINKSDDNSVGNKNKKLRIKKKDENMKTVPDNSFVAGRNLSNSAKGKQRTCKGKSQETCKKDRVNKRSVKVECMDSDSEDLCDMNVGVSENMIPTCVADVDSEDGESIKKRQSIESSSE